MIKPTVFIVDSDREYCNYLSSLLGNEGLDVQCFGSASTFLDNYSIYQIGCVLAEIDLPGMSGLQLQHELSRHHHHVPVIFITQHADLRTAVKATKQGAFNFLEKPVIPKELTELVDTALRFDQINHKHREHQAAIRARLENLTRRERQVLKLIIDKHTNKAIAARLGVSIKTIEFHRSRVMQKMHAESLLDLAEMLRVDRKSQTKKPEKTVLSSVSSATPELADLPLTLMS